MSSVKKGNTRHYGMRVHADVDAENCLVLSLEFTGANEHDIMQASKLLHGEEIAVHGDAGYIGLEKRPEMQCRHIRCYIAERPGTSIADRLQHLLASVRWKVEHVFYRIKIRFCYAKVSIGASKRTPTGCTCWLDLPTSCGYRGTWQDNCVLIYGRTESGVKKGGNWLKTPVFTYFERNLKISV